MLLLQNTEIGTCFEILTIIICTAFVLFMALMVTHRVFIKKANANNLQSQVTHIILKSLCVIFAVIFTINIADFAFVVSSFNKAREHGMVKNPDTNAYDLTLGEIREYNKYSLKESEIDPDDFDSLRGKIIIVYRYDCSDCLILHNDLKNLEDVIYISSRTETGIAFRDYFNPNLLKVPSGIYIRRDGKPVTLELYYNNNDNQTVVFDYDNWNRLLNIQNQDSALK